MNDQLDQVGKPQVDVGLNQQERKVVCKPEILFVGKSLSIVCGLLSATRFSNSLKTLLALFKGPIKALKFFCKYSLPFDTSNMSLFSTTSQTFRAVHGRVSKGEYGEGERDEDEGMKHLPVLELWSRVP